MGSGISDAKGSWDSLFGKKDKYATNDVLNGKVVATGTQGAQTVADPNAGLNDSQMRNRKLAKLGLGGASGMLGPGQPQSQGAPQAPIQFAPQQQDLSGYFAPRQRNPFFGY
jgi:hypothetical protein